MNKKFLSAILFGALMVTSTGTFVSCKDYDDEIDEINNKISGIESTIADLQKKVVDGSYVKSIGAVANGFTVTMSDGSTTTITVKDGENGKDGTEWTISEDGFWVCNGEKTDVKAVGEKGEDGQQEVKKENGKWYLWNAETEAFEEVTVSASADANVPYYYTDPTDPNYTILVVYDENGENEKAIRLPMAADLGQIVVLGNDLKINYYRFNGLHKMDGTTVKDATWDGPKAMPANGEYMLTANQNAVYVQVVPSNYDISKLSFKLVNTKGDEAPVVFGTPVPTTDAVARVVSESGVYAIPYTLKDMTKAEMDAYEENIADKALSLVANESVRSTYTYGVALNPVTTGVKASYEDVVVPVESLGSPVTVTPTEATAGNVYDSYLVMADATAKADSVRYGISINGMTVSYNENIQKGVAIKFIVRQVTAAAMVDATEDVTITFGQAAVNVTEFVLASQAHNAVATYYDANNNLVNNQFIVADFAPYFAQVAPTAGERLIWNQDMADITLSNVKVLWDELNTYGESVHEGGIDVTADFLGGVSYQTADGKDKVNNAAVTKADFGKLKLQFKQDYPGITLSNGTLKAIVTIENTRTGAIHTVEIPFTVSKPTADEITDQVAWNNLYYSNGVLKVVDVTTLDLINDMWRGYGNLNVAGAAANSSNDKIIVNTTTGVVTLASDGKNNTTYTVKGLKIDFLGSDWSYVGATLTDNKASSHTATKRSYSIDNIGINFATTKGDDIIISSDVAVMCAGKSVTIKDYRYAAADELSYKLVDFAGDVYDVANAEMTYEQTSGAELIENIELVENTVTIGTGDDAEEVTSYDIVITSADTRISQPATVSVKLTFTWGEGDDAVSVTVPVTITVNAAV